jgi:hypothetical protein
MIEGYVFGTPQKRGDNWLLFPLAIPGSDTLSSVGYDISADCWGVNVRRYSVEDKHAGPIIDRLWIGTNYKADFTPPRWLASRTYDINCCAGDTRLVAALRFAVYDKLGATVELPI